MKILNTLILILLFAISLSLFFQLRNEMQKQAILQAEIRLIAESNYCYFKKGELDWSDYLLFINDCEKYKLLLQDYKKLCENMKE